MNQPSRRRLAFLILVGTILCLPLIGYGVHRTVESNCNDVRQWLPNGIVETQEYDWFVERFGSDEIVVVSWPGCNLGDSRIDLAASALAQWTARRPTSGNVPTAVDASADRPRYFKNVVTGPELLAELTRPPLRLKRSYAKARLSGTLIGMDGTSTGLLLQISEFGAANRHAAMHAVYETVESVAKVPRSQIRIGGQTAESVALDIESHRSRLTLTGISAFAALALAWCCLRQMRLVMAVASTALLCAAIGLSMVYFTGGTMCLLLVTMPTLIYVLAVSAAIHLTHYYLDEIEKSGAANAPTRAIATGWLPCTLTAATTAVGLGSLALSEIVPVRMFGIYSALGVLISLPMLFLFLPSVWQIWPAQPVSKRKRTTDLKFAMRGWVSRFPRLVGQNHGWIVASGMLVTLVLASGVARLGTSIKLLNLFSPDAQIIGDYQWLEEHLGGMVPVEVVVRFDPDNEVSILERMEVASMVGRGLKQMDKVDGVISAATFAPSIPRPGGLRRTAKRAIVRSELEKSADVYDRKGFVKPSPQGQLWRVSARVEALNALDYGHFIEQMRQRIDPLLAHYNVRLGGGISATYTGMVPLVYKAQRMLLDDLIKSFLLAFLLIGVVMVAMLGSLRAGLISMIPNAFPALVIFGGMGWAGQLCDIGAMMTASVALGIAVDDTIHFLSWFRRGVQQEFGRSEAVHLAYRRCGKAMLQTTVICGLGMLVFGLSSFVPTARFASLMFMLLLLALVGDLVLLPALLTGPLGRYFTKTQIQSVQSRRPVCSEEAATLAAAQWELHSVQDQAEKPAFAKQDLVS